MKKTILTLLAGLCAAAIANGGPESFSGKEMQQVAPAPPPCPTWTGFYLGVTGGYDRALFDPSLSLGGGWIGSGDEVVTAHAGNRDLDVNGGQVGGVIGYNFQLSNFVLGIEGSGSY